ncbi:MAG: single-stranded DNA-binding protein [Candidatus Electrothrix sp. YB6]
MINKVILIGNLGADPELKYTQSGVPVATLSVATNERWKDKDGQQQEHTEWHRIVAWRQLAEICNEYYHKGARVYVEGKLQTRKWQDQNGNDRYTTEVVAREMKILSSRGEGGSSGGSGVYDPGPAASSPPGGYDDFSGDQSGGGTGSDVPF